VEGKEGGGSVAGYRSNGMRSFASCGFRLMTVLLAGMALTAAPALGHAASPYPDAVVFAREQPKTEVIYQPLGGGPSRPLYSADHWGDLAFLPSPDGRWLVLWDAQSNEAAEANGRGATRWSLISVASGETTEIGKTEGDAWLLPYWDDSTHLALEGDIAQKGDSERSVFDLMTRQLSRPLPRWEWTQLPLVGVAPWVARTRLEVYAQRHLRSDLNCLSKALNMITGGPGMGLDAAVDGRLRQPPEYLLLRSMGIPSMGELSLADRHYFYPAVACSPDHTTVAYAWICEKAARDSPSPRYLCDRGTCAAIKEGVYARVDVFTLTTGDYANVSRIQWEGWKPSAGASESPETWPPWNEPRVAIPGYRQPNFGDLRWSRDGKYLSFTTYGMGKPSVTILETGTWKEVAHIPDALDAFVVPAAQQGPE
jgi:hypothetical protein